MKRIYNYRTDYSNELENFLKSHHIKYTEKINEFVGMHILIFSVVEDLELVNSLSAMVKFEPIIENKFSSAELSYAKLFSVSSSEQSVNIINNDQAYKTKCQWVDKYGIVRTGHKQQVDSFEIAKKPSIKKNTAFYHSTVGFGELFADDRIIQLVTDQDLKGIKILQVLDKKQKVMSDFYQLGSDNIIQFKDINIGFGETVSSCPICKEKKIILPQAYQFHLKLNLETDLKDFYISDRIFGEGIPEPCYFISQKFYKLLERNNLSGGLKVTPVLFD